MNDYIESASQKDNDYIVSARKYRPTTFSDVVGQKALTTTLQNAVLSGKLAHAYLFCGPRGVGKTTCARIFARAINCLNPSPTGDACGQCESCIASSQQRSLNIFELDAASNNSVEHIKSLMEQTRIPPQNGRYKVFIIDEVHMLSTAAFNAFLKTLEEPPAHVIFILATTEKHKILPTILSRCQVYDFERMSISDIISYLQLVAAHENIHTDEQALAVIAEKADGGMRDALSIFDQCVSFSQGNLSYEKVLENLNVLDSEYYFSILDLCVAGDAKRIMIILNSLISKGFDPQLLILGLARHTRNVLMASDPTTIPLIEASDTQRQRFAQQALKCSPQMLTQCLKLMNACDINYRLSNNKRLLVELTLIEMTQTAEKKNDDDGQVNKLKPLFSSPNNDDNNLNIPKDDNSNITDNKTASVVSLSDDNATKTVRNSSPDGNKPPQPKLNSANIGFSWTQLKKTADSSPTLNNNNVSEKNNKNDSPDKPLSQDSLDKAWIEALLTLGKNGTIPVSTTERIKNIKPLITDSSLIKLIADNQLLFSELQKWGPQLTLSLKSLLNNSSIKLDISVNESNNQAKALTQREQLEDMANRNPNIQSLIDSLDLKIT